MSSATEELTNGAKLAGKDIINMANMLHSSAASTQQVSASSEEQTATMQELSNLAHNLTSIVENLNITIDYFKI